CGGDRDRTKRPIMGELGVRLADFAYITSDNPRTEDPQAIIDDIVAGVKEPKERWCVICDRREAIKTAILNAEENEILILAGKGHETYQIIGKEKTHLDEREEVAAALELRG
ncbi:MAG: UDP-N-acetylmuramoyl-L-alanyl-D-glutamate--2,6-diaminopimelate ligase, partial [Oscillospiraceae bacterium]|nr:UDP-N-acetylmuramoyl-L-alanyl-D-glutamate--2,6-diaminopimelate ligase [Oscillospiraceae bacterium]